MRVSHHIPTPHAITHPRTIRESCASSFNDHLRNSNQQDRAARADGPLPFDLELQKANQQYRRAERDTFEPSALNTPPGTRIHDAARACEPGPAVNSLRATPTDPTLSTARLGEILPVRDTHKVARLSSAYQPSARAGSIVDLMI